MTIAFAPHRMKNPAALATLMDAEKMRELYNTYNSPQMAKMLHCGQVTVRRYLRLHDIPLRKRSQPPPGARKRRRLLIRDVVYRLYLERFDRCPPACNGRDKCEMGERCVFEGETNAKPRL